MTSFVDQASNIVSRLAELDRMLVTFGSSKHKYTFRDRVTLSRIESFDSKYSLSLPEDYRSYLVELGNGGPGPYYGIEPLEFDNEDLHSAFIYTDKVDTEYEWSDEEYDDALSGAIHLAVYGCGTEVYLITKGKSHGEVWYDGRYEFGLVPAESEDGSRHTFASWWLEDMKKKLSLFEQVKTLMDEAVDHEYIHKQLDGEFLQLHIDEAMLSIMGRSTKGAPTHVPDKAWGVQCGLVDDHYENWLRGDDWEEVSDRSLWSRIKTWFS